VCGERDRRCDGLAPRSAELGDAARRGANAVVGVDIDYETIGTGSGSMLMVTTSGTAIVVR
jgi:uncharacterized protein YbjQ (UPF0145 family)